MGCLRALRNKVRIILQHILQPKADLTGCLLLKADLGDSEASNWGFDSTIIVPIFTVCSQSMSAEFGWLCITHAPLKARLVDPYWPADLPLPAASPCRAAASHTTCPHLDQAS